MGLARATSVVPPKVLLVCCWCCGKSEDPTAARGWECSLPPPSLRHNALPVGRAASGARSPARRIEVRVQEPDLGDPVDGEVVLRSALADGFGGSRVVNALGLCLCRRYIEVGPGDTVSRSVPATSAHVLAPIGPMGMCSPSVKLRLTRYLGMLAS